MVESLLKEIFIQIANYLIVALAVIIGINFWSKGFLWQWFKVKKSRDALVLVKIRLITQDYYRPGRLEEKVLVYKNKDKAEKRIKLPDSAIYRSMGIIMVDVDDEKNVVNDRDYNKIGGHDTEAFGSLLKRALFKPSLLDDKTKIIIGICILTTLVVIISAVLGYNWHKETMEALAALKQVAAPVVTNVAPVNGGV